MSNDLASLAQAYLFAEGGTLSLKRLSQLMDADATQVAAALDELGASLEGTGLSLVRSETEATLVVAARESDALRIQYEKELGREIGEAGLEVLAILLYRGPSTRAQIDYIRGVNTSSTMRTLLARGLAERAGNPSDSREYIYRPTVELLAHIGAQSMQDVPEYGTISNELKAFEGVDQDNGPFSKTINQGYGRDTTDTDGGSPIDGAGPGSDGREAQ